MVRNIADYERAQAAKLAHDHAARLALDRARERDLLVQLWDGPAIHNGHARHSIELAARRRMRSELRQALLEPLIASNGPRDLREVDLAVDHIVETRPRRAATEVDE